LKLLFDQNISFKIVSKIDVLFPGSEQVRRLKLENASDFDIWTFAKRNQYSVVTFDSDYFDINTLHGTPPKIIWVRSGNLTTDRLTTLLTAKSNLIIEYLQDDSLNGCLQLID
jgi:predicted nuclease of predicted toxin-antitoxin system